MLLKRKFVNQLTALLPQDSLRISIRNIKINGSYRGCSGHVTYQPSGTCVYLNTETTVVQKCMCRLAENETDYSSNRLGVKGCNRWAGEKDLAACVRDLLLSN